MTGLLLLANTERAAAAEPTESAAAHFAGGVELAKQGDLETAATEFEAAYRLRPHPSVLYNLGQTYASLARPIEAVSTLKRYLAEAPAMTPVRRQEVMALITFHQQRVGKLAISLTPADSELLLDGKPITLDGSSEPLDVAVGSHVLVAQKEGYDPVTFVQPVRPREVAEVAIALQAKRSTPSGWLEISCLPDATTYLDGKLLARTVGNKPVAIDEGPHLLTFSRAGYETQPVSLDVHGYVTAACKLEPSATLTETAGSRLRVAGAPPRSKIFLDGKLYRGELLPPGRHALRVESQGYEAWSSVVTLPGGRTTVVEVAVVPTPAQRRLLAAEARSKRRTYAYVGGGVGAVLFGVAGGLYAVSRERYRQYSAESERLSRDLSNGPGRAEDVSRAGNLATQAAGIERLDYLALTSGLLGAALLGTSIGLYVSAGSGESRTSTGGMLGLRGMVW